jgi:uncharacterized membrane protein
MEGSFIPPSNEELSRELADLRRRVETLERAAPPAGAQSISQTAKGAPPASVAAQSTPSFDVAAEGRSSSLESRIGAQIFNRVGVFAVLAGAAWFLKLAIDRAWIGPGLRVVVGLLAAAGLVVWSERFRRSGSRSFSFTLKALGSGIAYLSLWAAFNLYHLLPAWMAFAAMVLVTLLNAALAWRQNSELLAALALAGGLATPALLSNGGEREIFLFSYLLLLDIGAVGLTALRPWPRLTIGAFAGTAVYYGAWQLKYAYLDSLATSGVFLTLFFLLFTIAPIVEFGGSESGGDLRRRSMLSGLPVAVGTCTFAAVEDLLTGTAYDGSIPWVIGLLALIYLGLVLVGERVLALPNKSLAIVHFGMAAGFFALAGWLGFHGYGIALTWIVEMLVLVVTPAWVNAGPLLRPLRLSAAAMAMLVFAALLLLEGYDRQSDSSGAFANVHFATYLAGLAAFAVVVWFAVKAQAEDGRLEPLTLESPAFLAGFGVIAFNVIGVLAVSVQIDRYWRHRFAVRHFGIQGLYWHAQPAYVNFTYSVWFMLYGATLMAVGFWRRSAFLRWQALVLLTLSIGKVFLFDTSHLSEGYRVASFLGLGVLLLTVSFAYQRDWLGLKRAG